MKRIALTVCGLMLVSGALSSAHAAPITLSPLQSFPEATFGGNGIPTDAVAVATFDGFNGDVITIALTAHQRFGNPALTNDGAGTFTAGAGSNTGDPNDPNAPGTVGATWNIGYYVNIVGGGTLGDYEFNFLYDFDPAAGTDENAHGLWRFSPSLPNVSLYQDSQNMMFEFLATGFPPVIIAPGGAFDPDASGEYTFGLRAYAENSSSTAPALGSVGIAVDVVPEPATLALMAIGGLALWRQRRRV